MSEQESWRRQLGKVRSVDLFLEDHDLLTFYIQIDFGSSSQGFGGVALCEMDQDRLRRVGTAAGMDLILQLLRLFGVRRLEEIVGRVVYAERLNHGGNIKAIEVPDFDKKPDSPGRFSLDEWRKDWYPE